MTANEARSQGEPIFLVSWNVASWASTVSFIQASHGSVAAWLQRHRIDVLCLQEVKMISEKIVKDSPCVNVPGYDSYWCPCREKKSRGFNGVAVFARRGVLPVVEANSEPFSDPQFDDEGRCMLIDFGSFVLFNVYVPNSGSQCNRLPYKLQFLGALSRKMEEYESAGRPVVLCGDLNLSARGADVFYLNRVLDLKLLKTFVSDEEAGGSLSPVQLRMVSEILEQWDTVKAALSKKQVSHFIFNATTGPKDKWKVLVPHPGDSGKLITLGRSCDSESEALNAFSLEQYSVSDPYNDDAPLAVWGPDEMTVEDVVECMTKICRVNWSKGQIAELSKLGRSYASKSCQVWFKNTLNRLDMVDSFAALYPHAQGRFTCWDQYRNRRYENEGSRIDYFVVNREFFNKHVIPGAPLYVACDEDVADPLTAEAALRASTANGGWRPAPFDGSGICEGTPEAYEAQFYAPATGLIYTPPQFSDHIAVSLLIRLDSSQPNAIFPPPTKQTKKAQPHLFSAQKSIDMFFQKKPSIAKPIPAPNQIQIASSPSTPDVPGMPNETIHLSLSSKAFLKLKQLNSETLVNTNTSTDVFSSVHDPKQLAQDGMSRSAPQNNDLSSPSTQPLDPSTSQSPPNAFPGNLHNQILGSGLLSDRISTLTSLKRGSTSVSLPQSNPKRKTLSSSSSFSSLPSSSSASTLKKKSTNKNSSSNPILQKASTLPQRGTLASFSFTKSNSNQ